MFHSHSHFCNLHISLQFPSLVFQCALSVLRLTHADTCTIQPPPPPPTLVCFACPASCACARPLVNYFGTICIFNEPSTMSRDLALTHSPYLSLSLPFLFLCRSLLRLLVVSPFWGWQTSQRTCYISFARVCCAVCACPLSRPLSLSPLSVSVLVSLCTCRNCFVVSK